MVQKACGYVDETPDLQTKLKLIDTLRTVTLGKVRKKWCIFYRDDLAEVLSLCRNNIV